MKKKIMIMALVCLAILILISVLYYYFFVYGFSISTDTFVNINVEFDEENVLVTADTINSGYAFAGYDAVLTEGELFITPRYSMASNFHRSGKLEITYDTNGRLFDKISIVGISEEDKREIWSVEETRYKNVDDLEGVTLKTSKDSYDNNVDEICFIFENDTDKEYIFGEHFQLEKLKDGKWYQLLPNEQDRLWTLIGYPLKANSIREGTLNLGELYGNGNLEDGRYRIVKGIHYKRSVGDLDHYYLTAEFDIT